MGIVEDQHLLENCFFKTRIMTTGPTPVPDFVHAAMTTSVFYHRGPAFAEVMQEVRMKLPKVFGTKQEVLIFSGSGTLAMEGAIANFFNPGDHVISINAGKFGERWGQQAKVYGLQVHEITVAHGQAVDVKKVEELLETIPNVRGVLSHISETSTGVRHDVKAITKLAHSKKDCLSLVDCVTACGVFAIPMDQWGIDVVIGGSQKGMMLPPGLAFGSASERAWQRADQVKSTRYYMDWRKEIKNAVQNTGAFTSPVTLIGGLREVLRYFEKVGLDNVYRRSWKLSAATRAAAQAMGFELFVKNALEASAACTPVMAEGNYTSQIRERFGMTISGGQDALKGKIVRIGHIGYIDAWDVMSQLMSVAWVAKQQGKKMDIEAGVGVFFNTVNDTKDYTPQDLLL